MKEKNRQSIETLDHPPQQLVINPVLSNARCARHVDASNFRILPDFPTLNTGSESYALDCLSSGAALRRQRASAKTAYEQRRGVVGSDGDAGIKSGEVVGGADEGRVTEGGSEDCRGRGEGRCEEGGRARCGSVVIGDILQKDFEGERAGGDGGAGAFWRREGKRGDRDGGGGGNSGNGGDR